ncbi:unnamed protein product [Larinioides sclopetarius]|uniref:Uncharacterized protein n=1 Tax=Larinioides sclopetarius TaxID=280406 RepID=A0AAV1Z972_9ARAC
METAYTSNERTPLLGDGTATNKHRKLHRISAISSEQTPIDGNHKAFNEQAPPEGNHSIKPEESLPFGEGTSSNSDTNPLVPCPTTVERETNEVPLEEIVQAMCSAWQRNRGRRREVELNFFTTKELYALHLAWKNVTRGRHCSSQPHIIAEALAAAIEDVLQPRRDEDERYIYVHIGKTMEKGILTVNLLREWERITKGFRFPGRYIETIFVDSDVQPLAVSEFGLRQVELYDKFRGFIQNARLQIILHTLLIIWPVSILIVGSKYMDCLVSQCLSYLLIILGCVGCSAILIRLALMYLTSRAQYPYDWFWEWIVLRVIEFTFFIVFIVEAIYFFNFPITELDPNHCVKTFYSAALVVNCVSIALVSAYVLIYSIKICAYQFDFWHWILRRL